MRIAVMGLGNLGSAVAYMMAQNGHQLLAWEYDEAVVDELNSQRTNSRYLPGFSFPPLITATTQMADLLSDVDFLLVTLPSRFIESVLKGEYVPPDLPLVNMSKGLDAASGETAYQLLERLFPNNPKAMLAGPSLANEFVQGVVTGLVAASSDRLLQQKIAKALNSARLAVQFSNDPVGTELGGILKNVYALGLGVVDGQAGSGLNFKGAYFTEALSEMTALAVKLGADPASLIRISGMGDLITTALSEHSHNRKMGKLLAKGQSLAKIKEQMGVLPEGYNSLPSVLAAAKKHHLSLPLAVLIAQLLAQSLTVDGFFEAFTELLKGD